MSIIEQLSPYNTNKHGITCMPASPPFGMELWYKNTRIISLIPAESVDIILPETDTSSAKYLVKYTGVRPGLLSRPSIYRIDKNGRVTGPKILGSWQMTDYSAEICEHGDTEELILTNTNNQTARLVF